jgi:hypothetical protein
MLCTAGSKSTSWSRATFECFAHNKGVWTLKVVREHLQYHIPSCCHFVCDGKAGNRYRISIYFPEVSCYNIGSRKALIAILG